MVVASLLAAGCFLLVLWGWARTATATRSVDLVCLLGWKLRWGGHGWAVDLKHVHKQYSQESTDRVLGSIGIGQTHARVSSRPPQRLLVADDVGRGEQK